MLSLLFSIFTQQAWAVADIGEVFLIQGKVQAISSSGDVRDLASKSPIYEGDTIKTIGAGAIVFDLLDGTRWEVMDASEMKISNYHFANASNDGATYDLIQGNIRYISGEHGETKAKVVINTPDGNSIEPQGTEITFSMVFKITVVQVISGSAKVSTQGSSTAISTPIIITTLQYLVTVEGGEPQGFTNPNEAMQAFNQAVNNQITSGESIHNSDVDMIVKQTEQTIPVEGTDIEIKASTTEINIDLTITTEPKDKPASPSS